MKDYDYLKFCLELLNLMIDEFEELEWKSNKADSVKRLHVANENLKKAYCVAEIIIENGGI